MNIKDVKLLKKEAEQAISQILITLEAVTAVQVTGCAIRKLEGIGSNTDIQFTIDMKL